MIHAVSGKGRMEECLLELDMDTGRCRIAPLPGMGEGLKLRWFTGDWLLVQGNGEILSDDFAQLINRNTREVLRIRPGMFGGEKMQHIGILTDGTVVIVTRRDRVGPVFRYARYFTSWEQITPVSFPNPMQNRIIENYCSGVYLSPDQVIQLLKDMEQDPKVLDDLEGLWSNGQIAVLKKALSAAAKSGVGLLEATEVVEPNPISPNESTS